AERAHHGDRHRRRAVEGAARYAPAGDPRRPHLVDRRAGLGRRRRRARAARASVAAAGGRRAAALLWDGSGADGRAAAVRTKRALRLAFWALCPGRWATRGGTPVMTRANRARSQHHRRIVAWHRRSTLLAHAQHRELTRQHGSTTVPARASRGPESPGVLAGRDTSSK